MADDSINVYTSGDVARLQATFADQNGTPRNPTTVTAAVTDPSGTTASYTTPQIVNDSQGNYHLDVPVGPPGDWYYIFQGSGVVTASQDGTFTVSQALASALSPSALTSLTRARAHILRDVTNSSQDLVLAFYINAYSTAVINYCRRELHATDNATRQFAYDGSGLVNLAPFELRNADSLVLYSDESDSEQQTLAADDFRLEPIGKTPEGTYLAVNLILPDRLPGSYGFGWQLEIAGDWGMASVPYDVELATLVAVDDAYRNPAGFQSVQMGPYSAQEEPTFAPSGSLPAASLRLLTPYRRRARAGTLAVSRPPALRIVRANQA